MGDLVGNQRAAWAAGVGPALSRRCKHEVIDDELAASLEQIEQSDFALRALEDIVLFDLDHRLPAPFGRQRIALTRGSLFFCEQLLMSSLPLFLRNNPRKRLLVLALALLHAAHHYTARWIWSHVVSNCSRCAAAWNRCRLLLSCCSSSRLS